MTESRNVFGVDIPVFRRAQTYTGRKYMFEGVDRQFNSVTTVLDSIPKPELKRWLARQYMLKVKKFFNVPKSYDEIQAMVNSLYSKAADGESPDNSAAEFGTAVHEICEEYVKHDQDEGLPSSDTIRWDSQYEKCMGAFLRWYKQVRDLYDWELEVPLYHWVHGYAGTADLVMRHKATGELLIGDIKTSKKLYPTYDYQIAAYAEAFVEMGFGGKVQGGFLLHLDKMNGLYHERVLNRKQMANAFNVFEKVNIALNVNSIYERDYDGE